MHLLSFSFTNTESLNAIIKCRLKTLRLIIFYLIFILMEIMNYINWILDHSFFFFLKKNINI